MRAPLLLLLLCPVGLGATGFPTYPVSYSGGVDRTIFVELTLRPAGTYIYTEWTHAGYSVYDSGRYQLHPRYLSLTSVKTIHQTTNNRKRVHGKTVPLPDQESYRALFRHTKVLVNSDTLVMQKRHVLYNKGFTMYLQKDS